MKYIWRKIKGILYDHSASFLVYCCRFSLVVAHNKSDFVGTREYSPDALEKELIEGKKTINFLLS